MTSPSQLLVALALTLSWFSAIAVASASPNTTPADAESVDRLYRLDCGHSLANDESVWTPGENVGKTIEFSSTCYLIRHGRDVLMWDTGVPEQTIGDPKGWSTLPNLIVYHLDKTVSSQLAEIGLSTSDVNYLLVSHTHGDHIGNVSLFPNATVVMQKAEYDWINAPLPSDPDLKTLVTLARTLLGRPNRLELISGDIDLFRDGSMMLLSTPGHTPGSQSLMVHLKNTGYVILSGDVAHLEDNFNREVVPAFNVDKAASIASMERIKGLMAEFHAKLLINHDKRQTDLLKLLPDYYD